MTDDLRAQITAYIESSPMGWCSLEKALALAETVIEARPQASIEIGVFGGRSLIPVGMALKELGQGIVWGIDPWQNEAAIDSVLEPENIDWWSKVDLHDIHRRCMEDIWKLDLSGHIGILRTTSQQAAHLFHNVQWLHNDGNHSETASTRDVSVWLPKLPANAILWMDDTCWPSTQKAVAMIEAKCDLVQTIASPGCESRCYRVR